MWSDSDTGELNVMDQASPSSEVCGVVVDARVRAAAIDEMPNIAQLNVTQNSSLHLGPRFVSVTQNVHNAEMVKTRFLGLELISVTNTLRCSIAVFICCVIVVASALAFILFKYILVSSQMRLDLDLPLPRYIWHIIKSTSRAERLWCATAFLLLLIVIALIVFFNKRVKEEPVVDTAPHEWNITRAMWLAKSFVTEENTTAYEPLRLVIIQHTVSQPCHVFKICAAEIRQLQSWIIRENDYDIPYNFLIGNDGRVYEGRGWRKVGAHTRFYNNCSLGIAFIGDYREEEPAHSTVTDLQINRTMKLLEYGVKVGYLHPDYHVMGAKDLKATASPGSNLYNAIQKWDHYNNGSNYRNKTCKDIYADF